MIGVVEVCVRFDFRFAVVLCILLSFLGVFFGKECVFVKLLRECCDRFVLVTKLAAELSWVLRRRFVSSWIEDEGCEEEKRS